MASVSSAFCLRPKECKVTGCWWLVAGRCCWARPPGLATGSGIPASEVRARSGVAAKRESSPIDVSPFETKMKNRLVRRPIDSRFFCLSSSGRSIDVSPSSAAGSITSCLSRLIPLRVGSHGLTASWSSSPASPGPEVPILTPARRFGSERTSASGPASQPPSSLHCLSSPHRPPRPRPQLAFLSHPPTFLCPFLAGLWGFCDQLRLCRHRS